MDITWPVKHMNSRQMIAVSLVLTAILAAAIFIRGVPMSMEFKGGTLIRVRELDNSPDIGAIEPRVKEFLGAGVDVKATEDRTRLTGRFGLDVETDKVLSDDEKAQLREILSEEFSVVGSYSAESAGPIITSIYKEQAQWAITVAVIAMAIIIFITFRHSLTVGVILLCIGLDMLGVVGFMAAFGVPLSLASVAGILMLVGYLVDTHILLSVRVLKRLGGEVRERMADAMKTGLMMSGTTLLAVVTINVITITPALYQLTAVLIFGILVGTINTWFLNAGMVLWYAERLKGREYYVSI
ncbi:MAG: hypothetical protein QMC89_02175 [Candidatus Hodarchaeaceae archaeon]|nr:hypothetical protein [Candidatus Hodarchaeaceae archaeon]